MSRPGAGDTHAVFHGAPRTGGKIRGDEDPINQQLVHVDSFGCMPSTVPRLPRTSGNGRYRATGGPHNMLHRAAKKYVIVESIFSNFQHTSSARTYGVLADKTHAG